MKQLEWRQKSMKMRQVIPLIFSLIIAFLAFGCSRYEDPRYYRAREVAEFTPDHLVREREVITGAKLAPEYFDPFEPQVEEYRVSVGDVLEVAVFGHDDTVLDRVTVAPDGRLYYLFLDGMAAAGKTLEELEQDVEGAIASFIINPEVSILPRQVQNRSFRILGKVAQPGVYPISSSLTIRQAIGEAGGIVYGGFAGTTINAANFTKSFLVRNGERLAVDFEKLILTEGSDQNIYVRPGDYIYIASSLVQDVFLVGEVPQQKPIPYKDGLTLIATLSGVTGINGGVLDTADLHKITVVRGSLENPQVITADMLAILEGKARDVYLMPGDIVYVPNKTFRFGRELARTALNAFIGAFGGSAGGHYANEHWFLDQTVIE